MAPQPTRVGLLVFPQFEVLDVFGPMEVLNLVARMHDFKPDSPITLHVISETGEPMSSGPIPPFTNGKECAQSIVAHYTLDNAPELDVIFIPGGIGTGPKRPDGTDGPPLDKVINFVKERFPKIQYLFTVCTGAGIAARAGVLDGHKATTNKAAWGGVVGTGPKTHWVAHARWVVADDNKIWTTSGVSAGTDGFIAWADYVYGTAYKEQTGKSIVEAICAEMEYTRAESPDNDPWQKYFNVHDVLPQA